ncbi:MAG: fused MFS/spermidine synthase [Alphaproteobacteria bacterium]|nr:fused MFS/spermidine synthase [Alphaproteobacteria bacterium]
MALLKQFKTPFGIIRISRSKDGTLSYYQSGCFHSQSTPRGISVCAYVHVMQQIILQTRVQLKAPKRVLIIGCGGGTLATMLMRRGCKVTVVDINPVAFTIARDYFYMPAEVMCVAENGLTYIRTTRQRFDAVVVDVFDSMNNVPTGFRAKKFFAAAKAVLSSGGVFIMNVITKNDADKCAKRISTNAAIADMDISIYDWPGHKDRNTLIVGGSLNGIAVPDGSEPSYVKADMKGLVCKQVVMPKKCRSIR